MGWDGWGGILAMVVFALVLAVVVLAVVRLLLLPVLEGTESRRDGADRGSTDGSSDRAIEVLRERFARGEIDEDEFERRVRTLETGRD